MKTLGIVGLGLMGTAMAERSMDAGYAVVGFDVDRGRCAALRTAGASIADSAADVMTRCRTLVLALYDAPQVEATMQGLPGSTGEDRTVFICTTTCSPDDISRISARAAEAGHGFVEMPVSGTSAQVRSGSATSLLAGAPADVSSVRDVVDTLFPRSVLVGAIGDASRAKLAINLILQINRAALAEGLVFAERMGLDGETFLRAAKSSAAYSSVMDAKGAKMLARDYTPQSRISQTLKDAHLIVEEARHCGLKLPMAAAQMRLLEKAMAVAGGDADSAAVIEAIGIECTAGDAR